MIPETLGDLIATAQWSQRDLAEAAGLRPEAISRLVGGLTQRPHAKTVGRITAALARRFREMGKPEPTIQRVFDAIWQSWWQVIAHVTTRKAAIRDPQP